MLPERGQHRLQIEFRLKLIEIWGAKQNEREKCPKIIRAKTYSGRYLQEKNVLFYANSSDANPMYVRMVSLKTGLLLNGSTSLSRSKLVRMRVHYVHRFAPEPSGFFPDARWVHFWVYILLELSSELSAIDSFWLIPF